MPPAGAVGAAASEDVAPAGVVGKAEGSGDIIIGPAKGPADDIDGDLGGV